MSRTVSLVSLAAGVVALAVLLPPAADPGPDVLALGRAGRDADLRGDWEGLNRSHEALEALPATGPARMWVDYYLGYVDWRRSSLAYIGEGPAAMVELMRRAGGHFERALAADSTMADARILLGLVQVFQIAADPGRAAELARQSSANVARALVDGRDNPRVRFISAMMVYFSPRSAPAARDSALAAWRETAASFPAPIPGVPEWGRAEAWAWLGGALLVRGDTTGARDALERALADRPDFWWARAIALPQALHSRLRHLD